MRWAMLGIVVFCLACGDNIDGPDQPPGSQSPLLTNTPMWTIGEQPCFGYRTAVADVNGDGFDDIIAYTPDCFFFSSTGESTPTELSIIPGTADGFGEPVTETLPIQGFDALYPRIQTGDVNGDGHADILFRTFPESTLFMGAEVLADTFTTSHVLGSFTSGLLFDVDGGGADEYLRASGGGITILSWSDELQGFAERDTLSGTAVSTPGDTNGDGLPDLFIGSSDAVDLYAGCRTGSSCNDGLSEPVRTPLTVMPSAIGDVNGDGRDDVIVRSATSALSVHLSDPDGVPEPNPVWTALPDPLHGPLARAAHLGDVTGDGRAGDIGVVMGGRIMLFRAGDGAPETLPAWEWYIGQATDPDYEGGRFTPLVVRDINGDGYQDVVMSVLGKGFTGSIAAYTGGQVPNDVEPPYLPTEYACSYHPGELPDLAVDADLIERSLRIRRDEFTADSCEVNEQCVAGPGERKLLDFSVAVQNFGGAAAALPNADIAPELYEFDTCHMHNHLVDFANYELVDSDGDVVVAGHKQGYFLIDVVAYCDMAPEAAPGQFGDYLFISPGWSDIYYAGLECQWIDVTDVPDGSYRLRVEVNTSGVFEEDDQVSNLVEVPIEITGDRVTLAGQ